MRRKLTVKVLLALCVVAVLAAPKVLSSASRARLLGDEHAQNAPAGPAGAAAARANRDGPTRVTTAIVQPGTLAETVTSSGTLLAAESVELQAEVSGKITAINFVEGTRVRKGQLLVKLNDADLQARRHAAMYEVTLAERREKRAAELLAQGFVIADEHDTALNEVNVRRAEIELTEAQIAKTEIRAPFDGIAGLRYVSEGAIVSATTQIATLQRIDTLKVDFAVPEKYAERIRVGSPIAFTVAGHTQKYSGEVYAYDPRIDTQTRTLLIRALCPNEDEVLLPGSFANVQLTIGETRDALLVPAEALVPDFQAAYVYVVADGKVERRQVSTGRRSASHVQILSGLAPGEEVVTRGLMQLRPGSAVQVDVDVSSAVLNR